MKPLSIIFLFLFSMIGFSQEGIPLYTDYLTDNYYLVHPSMAGSSFEGGKARMTLRKQWFGQEEAPNLQTLSAHIRLGNRSGVGAIIFNDQNGYHAQTGLYLTYAHHINFFRSSAELNQLSFGISIGGIQNSLDESSFDVSDYDPIISGIKQSTGYLNIDTGVSYNLLNFYAHFTIKNLLFQNRNLYNEFESNNQRKYLASAGYIIDLKRKVSLEPSFLFQLSEFTKEKLMDINIKGYYPIREGRLWAGLSYRRSFEGAQYYKADVVASQKLQMITSIVGIDIKNFVFAYNYSKPIGDISFGNGGFHQITLGFNFLRGNNGYYYIRGIL